MLPSSMELLELAKVNLATRRAQVEEKNRSKNTFQTLFQLSAQAVCVHISSLNDLHGFGANFAISKLQI